MVAKEMLQMKRCMLSTTLFVLWALRKGENLFSCLAAQITKRKENRFIVPIRFRFRFSYHIVVLC